MKKYFFALALMGFVLTPLSVFAVSGYTRTPSGTPVTNGSSTEFQFSYTSGDSTSFHVSAVLLFDQSGNKITCLQQNVLSGVSGTFDQTASSLSNTQVYTVVWGKIDQSAPTYDICTNVTTLTNFNSIVDGQTTLESGTPSYIYSAGGGGGGGSLLLVYGATTTATTTSALLGSIAFGEGIIVFFCSLGMVGYIYNTITDKKKKPWQ